MSNEERQSLIARRQVLKRKLTAARRVVAQETDTDVRGMVQEMRELNERLGVV